MHNEKNIPASNLHHSLESKKVKLYAGIHDNTEYNKYLLKSFICTK